MGVAVWLPESVWATCLLEADGKYPLETGGTFMGWWSPVGEAVITAMIGPGPDALHERYRFQPDQEWQLDEIARHYERSGRRETYLGDWHSHPDSTAASLSGLDHSVLRRVIRTPEARCSSPLMMILWGSSGNWKANAWRAQLTPRLLLWERLQLNEVEIGRF